MRRTLLMMCVCLGFWAIIPAAPAQVYIQTGAGVPVGPQAPTTPQAPVQPEAPDPAQAPAPVFAEAAPAGTEAPGGGYAPQMLGDSVAFFSGFLSSSQATVTGRLPKALAGSAFKVADNESPRPRDRIYLNTNYFTAVYHSLQVPGGPQVRLARQIVGMEKTFLGSDASIGVRVPFFQVHDSSGASISDLGNITLVAKAVLLSEGNDDRLICGGLAVTLPTGPNHDVFGELVPGAGDTLVDSVNPTIIQPLLGYFFQGDDYYVHGFSSLAIPTDDSVPVVWFNDIGVGYYIYRGPCCAIVPTGELHLTTPFGQQGSESLPVGVVHTLITTAATHFVWDSSILTLGVGFPLTGPQPFANEWIAQFNFVF